MVKVGIVKPSVIVRKVESSVNKMTNKAESLLQKPKQVGQRISLGYDEIFEGMIPVRSTLTGKTKLLPESFIDNLI
jgi:hypothetical protein